MTPPPPSGDDAAARKRRSSPLWLAALLAEPRLAKGALGVMRLRARLEQQLQEGAERLARTLNLATTAEVRELRRTVTRLQRQLDRQGSVETKRPGWAASSASPCSDTASVSPCSDPAGHSAAENATRER